MSKTDKPKTKPLTEAELAYFRTLNDEATVAYQRHLEAQQRLAACLAFLRVQHDAPEEGWGMTDLNIGFVQKNIILDNIDADVDDADTGVEK